MKSIKHKDTKKQYKKIVKLVDKAEKAAEKFIQHNKKAGLDIQIQCN